MYVLSFIRIMLFLLLFCSLINIDCFILNKISKLNPLFNLENGVIRNSYKNNQILHAEMRLLIHGTKNAYTTIRSGDVVIYELEEPTLNRGCTKRIGLYNNDGDVEPLCIRDKMADMFFIDHTHKPVSAQLLKNQGRLIRMVTATRTRSKNTGKDENEGEIAYLIDEWIDELATQWE